MVALLFGTAPAWLGIEEDVEYLVSRLRAAWPDVRMVFRADAGFATPRFYEVCERLGVEYMVGLGMNAVLKRHSAELLAEVVQQFEASGQAQRRFMRFEYRARTWAGPRCTIVKAEANAAGTNRRAVVTNRAGAAVLPEATYDEYAARGEGENRNKEVKRSMCGDRLSDHRYMANHFRLYLHCAAANLLVRLRRVCACPPAPEPASELPTAALAGRDRKRYFNRRREQDPLGEGHAETWRTRLIKVAAEVIVSARRVLVRLSGSWPFLGHYAAVCAAVARFPSPAPNST